MRLMRGVVIVALLAHAACEQAGRVVSSAMPLKKAIPELKYNGDRPDTPPLEERGNSVFTGAAFDDSGKLLITHRCSAELHRRVA